MIECRHKQKRKGVTVIMFVPMELIDEMKIVKKEIPQMNSQKAQNLLNDLKTEEKEVFDSGNIVNFFDWHFQCNL